MENLPPSSVYDKRDQFKFHIVNFPHLDSNIPCKPAYRIYISQLVRIGRICDNHNSFKYRHKLLTSRLIKQGYLYKVTLKGSVTNTLKIYKEACGRQNLPSNCSDKQTG